MENSERLSETKEAKEAIELIEKYFKLQAQINNPTRFGMIDALSDTQNIARQEITSLEQSQGDIYPMPWTSFQDRDLYRKLAQYQQGLYNYAVNKLGEESFKKLLKTMRKRVKINNKVVPHSVWANRQRNRGVIWESLIVTS